MEKIVYLNYIYNAYGDFKIQRLVKKNDSVVALFSKWIKYSDATENEKIKCNVRSLVKEEVVLDLEDHSKLDTLLSELKKYNLNYNLWSTGSRGYHIILIFPELVNWSEVDIARFRKYLCQIFNVDRSKGSFDTMIAIEWCEHFKTGNIKRLLPEKSTKGINNISSQLNSDFQHSISKIWLTNQHTERCVGVLLEDYRNRKPKLETIRKIKSQSKILQTLTGATITDRSGADFLIAKFCVENGITCDEYIVILLATKWSKIHIPKHGIRYAIRTYQNATKIEYGGI